MTKKIGIFEGGAHEQYLHALCRISEGIDYDITIFVTQDKYDLLRSSATLDTMDFDWVVKPREESMRSFLTTIEQRTSSLDMLFVSALYGGIKILYTYSQLELQCPSVLYLYNINAWFDVDLSLHNGIFTNIERRLRRKIVQETDEIAVEYPQFEPYISERYDWQGQVHEFPQVVYGGQIMTETETEFVISVPGNVDNQRRNYQILLDGIESCLKEHPESTELRLVGPPVGTYGREILNRCDRLLERGFNIETFDERLSYREFDDVLRESNLIVSPLRYAIENGVGGVELFGVTKGSGSVFDAVRYGVPVVFPEHFHVPRYLRPSSETYESSNEITEIVNRFIERDEYRIHMTEAAREASQLFSLESQQKRFEELIESVV